MSSHIGSDIENFEQGARIKEREEARHFEDHKHQLMLKGKAHGLIIETNATEGASDDPYILDKKNKKDKAHIEHILLLERLREELDDILERMDAIMHEMRDQMRKMRRGLKALENDDAALMVAFLAEEYPEEYDRKTLEGMSVEEVENETQRKVLSAEERYEVLKSDYKNLAEKYDQKIKDNPALKDKLTEEFAEREQQIQTEVEALGRSFREIRNEVGHVLGKNNEASKSTQSQKHQIENQGFTDDEFFAGAPDLTAEFDKAASGSGVEREHELTTTPPQNAPPPQTMKP